MREIKFRAQVKYWIKINNKIYKKKDWYYFNLYDISIDGGLDFIDKKTISQYIGLKDKNGKEIYEGDIVKVIQKGFKEIWTVEWDAPKFIVYNQLNSNRDIEINITEFNGNPYFTTYGKNIYELEVIDDIYENEE